MYVKAIQNILANSDFLLLLSQAPDDRKILTDLLHLSPRDVAYVSDAPAGAGLLCYGSLRLPFADPFPKDTHLYRLMTTKPEEMGNG